MRSSFEELRNCQLIMKGSIHGVTVVSILYHLPVVLPIDIVRFVNAQRIRWLGHVEKMLEEQMLGRILKVRLFPERGSGRPCTRWLDNVVMWVRAWRGRVEDRDGWRRVVKEAKAHQWL